MYSFKAVKFVNILLVVVVVFLVSRNDKIKRLLQPRIKTPDKELYILHPKVTNNTQNLQGPDHNVIVNDIKRNRTKYTDFQNIILQHAVDDLIIISTTDFFYLELALNLYYTSFVKFNITNYIFACTHVKACRELENRNIK